MNETLKAVEKANYQTVIIYPNTDSGGRKIIKVIKNMEVVNLFYL